MSPIGRVFLVLNLGLAGAFVAFSGTYLQRANNWKKQFEAKEVEMAAEAKRLTTQISGLNNEVNVQTRIAGQRTVANKQLETKVKEQGRDNTALQARLTTIEGTMKTSSSHLANIATELKTARQESKAAMDKAIAA